MTAPWIQRQLEALLAQRGHAWLLHGPSGLGQFELADALVRAWLCDQPTPQGACGQCASCHGIDVHTHPDLAALMPETDMLARDWPLPEKAQSDIDDKKRKPSKEIRVDAMREAIEFAQRTSARGRGKAVLVYPAERMNAITANALLKTLEEPAGDMRFVLATDAAHLLLPTIRSRCLAHTMAWPDEAEALAWLATQESNEPKVEHEETPYPLVDDLERFYGHLEQTLLSTGFIREGHPGQVMNKLRRMFTRARPESQELNILRGILASIEQKNKE